MAMDVVMNILYTITACLSFSMNIIDDIPKMIHSDWNGPTTSSSTKGSAQLSNAGQSTPVHAVGLLNAQAQNRNVESLTLTKPLKRIEAKCLVHTEEWTDAEVLAHRQRPGTSSSAGR